MTGSNTVLGGGGFHHLAIRAADFEKSVKFYKDILGFKETVSWGEGDDRAIMLDTGDGNCFEIFAGGSSEKKPEGALLHIALRTTDCASVIEKVRFAGMEITKEPTDVMLGSTHPIPVRIAFFKGPDGELIELLENT